MRRDQCRSMARRKPRRVLRWLASQAPRQADRAIDGPTCHPPPRASWNPCASSKKLPVFVVDPQGLLQVRRLEVRSFQIGHEPAFEILGLPGTARCRALGAFGLESALPAPRHLLAELELVLLGPASGLGWLYEILIAEEWVG